MKTIAIILASGSGIRLGAELPKQFIELRGMTILERSIFAFHNQERINEIIIVSHPDYISEVEYIVKKGLYKKVKKIVAGGNTRQESSLNGLNAIEDDEAKVLIHDSVRPFVTDRIINELIDELDEYKAVNVVIESADTIVEIDEENFINKTLNRKYLRRVQTPQGFHLSTIKKAHDLSLKQENLSFTDDCGLVQEFNLTRIKAVCGEEFNIKITYPNDIKLAENIIDFCDKI